MLTAAASVTDASKLLFRIDHLTFRGISSPRHLGRGPAVPSCRCTVRAALAR